VGAQHSAHAEMPVRAPLLGEARIVHATGGIRWRAEVVARLVSMDAAAYRVSALLVLRLECLSARRAPRRVSVPGARDLADVPDAVLRALIARPAGRRRAAG
jgi:hypothetical protein